MPPTNRPNAKLSATVAIIDTRLAAVEKAAELTEVRHREDIARIELKLGTIQASIDELKLSLARQPHCPKPGACLDLSDRQVGLAQTVAKLVEKVEELEDIKSRGVGVWKTVAIVAAVLGFFVTTGISIYSALKPDNPPVHAVK